MSSYKFDLKSTEVWYKVNWGNNAGYINLGTQHVLQDIGTWYWCLVVFALEAELPLRSLSIPFDGGRHPSSSSFWLASPSTAWALWLAKWRSTKWKPLWIRCVQTCYQTRNSCGISPALDWKQSSLNCHQLLQVKCLSLFVRLRQ